VTSGRSDWPQIMVGGGGRHQPVCAPLIRSVPGQQWIMATVAELVGFLLLLYNIRTYIYIFIYYAYFYFYFLMVWQEINAITASATMFFNKNNNNNAHYTRSSN